MAEIYHKVRDWETTLNRIKLIEQNVHENTKKMIRLFKKGLLKEIADLKKENDFLKKNLNRLKGKLYRVQEQLLNPEEQHG